MLRYLGNQLLASSVELAGATDIYLIEEPSSTEGIRLIVIGEVFTGVAPTLDAKIQFKDISGQWRDLPDASITQLTGVGFATLEIAPGLMASPNVRVGGLIAGEMRVSVTTVETVTFSVGVDFYGSY